MRCLAATLVPDWELSNDKAPAHMRCLAATLVPDWELGLYIYCNLNYIQISVC